MANFYYFDATGQKFGPVNKNQLQALAARGTISPETPLETEAGYKGLAGQIPGLNFSNTASKNSLQNEMNTQETVATKANGLLRKAKATGIGAWLLDFAFHDIRLRTVNLWVCRAIYAIWCVIALFIFIGGTCLMLYALSESARGTGPPNIESFVLVCTFVSFVFAPLSIVVARVACEWEIIMLDWVVETTKAAQIFIEESKSKQK